MGFKPMRHLDIDTLRGLACLLLVSFHVVGLPDSGLRLPPDHALVRINEMLTYVRMPLFSFISGYVYAMRPWRANSKGFVRGKARRLLLPLLTVGTLFALMQSLAPGTNGAVENWWLLHIVPVGHFWFLQALFIIFLAVAGLERWRLIATAQSFTLIFAGSLALFAFADLPRYFAASGAAYLLPFFLGGLACQRFAIGSATTRRLAAALLVNAVLWLWAGPTDAASSALAGLTVGLAFAFLLLRSGWQVRWMARIGGYSFVIYLLHVFFTAATRVSLSALGLSNPYAHLMLGLMAGVLGPIAAAMILARYANLEFWMLGKATR